MGSLLTPTQLERLKDHKYRSQGSSLTEVFMQPYWRWLVTKVPLWVAPNLITFVGLVINVATTIPVVLGDPNMEGLAPAWAYIACAIGFFIYQSLDAIDGKQARRTGTNNPLGELFDHGCDAISEYLVVVSGASAVGLQAIPWLLLTFVTLLMVLNFFYHWQTYVCGSLHFKLIDVTEAQFVHMAVLLFTAFLGFRAWEYLIPGTSFSLRSLIAVCVIGMSCVNLVSATYIILTKGVGKNGSTVADTSVLSPIITVIVIVPLISLYGLHSPGRLLQTQAILFSTALCLPLGKCTIKMMVATITKSPYPLFDYIMIGPLLAYLNLYFGTPLPEIYVVTAVAIFTIVDILWMCVSLCWQICEYLNVSCFTIPHPPKPPHTN